MPEQSTRIIYFVIICSLGPTLLFLPARTVSFRLLQVIIFIEIFFSLPLDTSSLGKVNISDHTALSSKPFNLD